MELLLIKCDNCGVEKRGTPLITGSFSICTEERVDGRAIRGAVSSFNNKHFCSVNCLNEFIELCKKNPYTYRQKAYELQKKKLKGR